MNKFINDNTLISIPLPSSFSTELLKHILVGCKAVGSLSKDTASNSTRIGVADFKSSMQFTFPKSFTRSLFAIEEVKRINNIIFQLVFRI